MKPNVEVLKACVGQIINDMMVMKPTEFLKYFEYIQSEQRAGFENVYIKKLLLSLQVIEAYKYNDIVNPDLVRLKCRTNLHNLVEKRPVKVTIYDNSYQTRLCKITKNNEDTIKQDGIPLWVETIYDEIKIFIDQLDDILLCNFMKYFLKNKQYHIIFPNLLSYKGIFTKNKLEEFIKVMNTDMIYDILSEIEFFYLIKDMNKNRSIFDFTEAELMSIITNITSYVDNLFNGKDYNKDNIIIRINPDKNYKYFSISFIIINKYNTTKYSSYIELYDSINIHDLLYNLQNNIESSYYGFIPDRVKSDGLKCVQKKGHKTTTNIKIPLNSIETIEYCILQQLQHNMDSLKIITSSYPLNKYHSYCSISILVLLGTSYYNITIKSVTFDEIKTNVEFKDKYLCELAKIQYKQSGKLMIGEGSLPATVEVIIKPVENPKINYTLRALETADYYNTVVLPRIKNEVIIYVPLILNLIWFKEYIRLIAKYNITIKERMFFIPTGFIKRLQTHKEIKDFINLTEKLLDIPIISVSIYSISEMVYYKEFIICTSYNKTYLDLIYYLNNIKYRKLRVTKPEVYSNIIKIIKINNNVDINKDILDSIINILYVSDILNYSRIAEFISKFINITNESYTIWYIPYMEVDYEKLLGFLTKLDIPNQLYNTNNEPINYNKKDINYFAFIPRDDVNMFTDFYEVFKSDKMLYNIRSVNIDIMKKLKRLLKLKGDGLIVFFHYPNADEYSILHLHAFPYNKNTEDIVGNFFDISLDRSYLFDKYEDITDDYFKKKNLLLTIKIPGEIGKLKNDIHTTEEYKDTTIRFKTSRPGIVFN